MSGAGYVLGTVAFTVASQMLLKWRMTLVGTLPPGLASKLLFLLRLMSDLWVLLGLLLALLAALCWMAALTKFELSHVYPFTSLSFVLVLILGCTLFRESLTIYKVVGIALILAGVAVIGVRP